ncbi:MAG: phospholipase D-like domain-containing protein, partial [Betaproteobacteria bacterium]
AEAAPWRTRLGSSSEASLHGKVFLADGERLFVGSFNLDPRSADLNTEMGLAIASPELHRALAASIERDLLAATYRLSLAADGRLLWEEQTAAGPVVHEAEPGAGLLRRVGARILSWLPIEDLL